MRIEQVPVVCCLPKLRSDLIGEIALITLLAFPCFE